MPWYEFYLRCVAAAYPEDKVIQKALAAATKTDNLPGNLAGGVDCMHHWVIAPPHGPASKGTCKLCGAVQMFVNSYATTVKDMPYAKRFSLKSNRRGR